MTESNIRRCNFAQCGHKNRAVDISKEPYVLDNREYYHKDCYEKKTSGNWKTEEMKRNLQEIKRLWVENINNSVSQIQLSFILNDLLSKGVSSDYLLFTMNYILIHNLNLNYPRGFPYFVDKKEIKEAYAKRKLKAKSYNKVFVAKDNPDAAPKFSIKQKPRGFSRIVNH